MTAPLRGANRSHSPATTNHREPRTTRHFSFSESVLKQCPTSPYRPLLLCDFLRQKLGDDIFERVRRVLANTRDPGMLLKEEPWIISDICGEENLSFVDVGITFGAF